jgi:UDP-3-O-[3-hydroxymyristoyl] N-acetylglucosamine deacetylase
MTVRPAGADAGVVFRRIDLDAGADGDANLIRLSPDAVVDTDLGTSIASLSGARVQTVEHLLAAVFGVGLDNVVIDLDAAEPPAMDGSAAPFARRLAQVGLDRLAAPRRVIRVNKPVEVVLGGRTARFEPAARLEIDIAIDFEDAAIGRQHAVFVLETERDAARFLEDLAPARTFAFLKDYEALRARGLARGGSLENCVVLDGGEVINEGGLRFADEFARHKALDALGDLALAGWAIQGRYLAERPGHALNNLALRALMDDPTAWSLEVLPEDGGRRERPASRLGGLQPATL